MEKELEEKLNRKLADKRTDELIDTLKQLIAKLGEEKGRDDELIKLIDKNTEGFDLFLGKLKEVSAPKEPKVTVNTDNTVVVKAVESAKNELSANLNEVKELLQTLIQVRLYDVKMTPTRSYGGVIDGVIVSTVVPKNKYEA